MNWMIKKFDELSAKELYEILRVRAEVFVVEQACVYQDLDAKDASAYHIYLEDDHQILAYARILEKGISYPEVSIGRVLTMPPFRGNGWARRLLEAAISFVENTMGEEHIRISAQAYLLEFYKELGFLPVTDIYLEDGIEHIGMLYTSKNSKNRDEGVIR